MDVEPQLPPGQRLTPELSRTNPEQFKRSLLQDLGRNAPRAARLWDNLEREDLVSTDRLRLNPDKWGSSNHTGRRDIDLGTSAMDKATKGRLIFEDWNFDYAKEVELRFTHELAHALIYDQVVTHHGEYPQTEEMLDILEYIRGENPREGLSTLGNIPFYKSEGSKIQGLEDMTEMVAYYLWDPQYLKRYLEFLSDASHSRTKQSLGLTELNSSSVMDFYGMVKSIADERIK